MERIAELKSSPSPHSPGHAVGRAIGVRHQPDRLAAKVVPAGPAGLVTRAWVAGCGCG